MRLTFWGVFTYVIQTEPVCHLNFASNQHKVIWQGFCKVQIVFDYRCSRRTVSYTVLCSLCCNELACAGCRLINGALCGISCVFMCLYMLLLVRETVSCIVYTYHVMSCHVSCVHVPYVHTSYRHRAVVHVSSACVVPFDGDSHSNVRDRSFAELPLDCCVLLWFLGFQHSHPRFFSETRLGVHDRSASLGK